jgi:hypothetical protein
VACAQARLAQRTADRWNTRMEIVDTASQRVFAEANRQLAN